MLNKEEFNLIFKKVILGHEGGYSNDPDDPGAETYRGISRKHYPDWEGWEVVDEYKMVDALDKLDNDSRLQESVKQFYYDNYWLPLKLYEFPDDIAYKLFDIAVNMGKTQAGKLLQRALNVLNRNRKIYDDLTVDGIIGPKTINAFHQLSEDDQWYLRGILGSLQFCRYMDLVEKNKSLEKYIRGWVRRAWS